MFTPGQPDDPHQPRPALVISDDLRNTSRESAIVVPIFSRGRPAPVRVALPRGSIVVNSSQGGFCDEIVTLDYRFFDSGPLGPPATAQVVDEVVRAARRAIGDLVIEPPD